MPSSCACCGYRKGKGASNVAMYRFPADKTKLQQWLKALQLPASHINEHSRICSRHFLHGDSANIPERVIFGKRSASPKQTATDRSKRARKRATCSTSTTPSPTPPIQRPRPLPQLHSVSVESADEHNVDGSSLSGIMSVSPGEPLLSDYGIHELPPFSSKLDSESGMSETALFARIEFLEAETKRLMSLIDTKMVPQLFRIEQIANNDALIRFYTGFVSYELLLKFFEFLGPTVYNLSYWGEHTEKKTTRKRKNMPLSPLNQCFLALVKLRLNLSTMDLANRFGISTGLVSKYFITWVCFMYQYLKEIDWTPSKEQVAATLPISFKEKYPTTYSIIDASEVYIETPSDLFVQSSTWSNYKHHNTAKFLIGCTPNGVISYISPLYVGSISDVELTRVSGYLDTLNGKHGVSVMADRGFTVRDQLASKGVDLNIPPFLERRPQMTPEEIKKGRCIAHLRIHVERAIGRIKNFTILKGTLPITMIRLANQIVSVCAWLTNFQPALIPLPSDHGIEEDVEEYFAYAVDEDYDADSEISDSEIENFEIL